MGFRDVHFNVLDFRRGTKHIVAGPYQGVKSNNQAVPNHSPGRCRRWPDAASYHNHASFCTVHTYLSTVKTYRCTHTSNTQSTCTELYNIHILLSSTHTLLYRAHILLYSAHAAKLAEQVTTALAITPQQWHSKVLCWKQILGMVWFSAKNMHQHFCRACQRHFATTIPAGRTATQKDRF